MSKSYYQDYVNHMMRFYVKWLATGEEPRDDIAKKNLEACVAEDPSEEILGIYRDRRLPSTGDAEAWFRFAEFSKRLAKRRGLI